MKKIIALLLILNSAFCILNSSSAQSFQWLTRMGGIDSDPNFGPDEQVRDIEVDVDGNVYACGSIRPTADFDGVPVTTYGGYDIFICKYNCHGNLVWVKTAGGNADDYAYNLGLDKFGHVYLTGFIAAGPIVPNTFFDTLLTQPIVDMFLAKFDTSGNYLWGKFAGTDTSNTYTQGFLLEMAPNGNPTVMAAVAVAGILFPGWPVNVAPYIVEFDTAGTVQKMFTFSANYSTGGLFKMDSQSNYIVYAQFDSDSALVGNQTLYNPKPGYYHAYVAKFTNAGSLTWVYTFTDTTTTSYASSFAYGTAVDSSDNIYVTGNAVEGIKCGNYVFTDPIPPLNDASPYVIKLTPLGVPLWAAQGYQSYGGNNSGVPDFKTNGNLAFSGGSLGITVFGTDTLQHTGPVSVDLYIAEITPNGNMLGAVQLACTGGYDVDSYVTKVDASDNVYIAGNFEGTLTGGTHSVSSAGGYTDGFIAKYGFNCTTNLTPDPSPQERGVLAMWPNPANTQLTIAANGLGNATVTISNLLGKVIYTSTLSKNAQATFNVSKLTAGMYVVSVNDGATTVVKKFVRE